MRLTLDYDVGKGALSKRCFLSRVALLRKMFPLEQVIIERSCSGTSFHVIVDHAFDTWEDVLAARRMLGDDPVRVAKDATRYSKGIACNVLFDKKLMI